VTTTFADLGVPAPMVASLAERGIDGPFPIQSLTLADTLAGRDVSGKAPTGSGKTLAFGIPLVIGCPTAAPRRPRRLVLVPTRELATQVADELRLLAGRKGPRVESFFGGVPIPRNDKALQRGVDIAVACPGRLADLIQQRMVRLDDVDVVVLDEADRMADMGFLPQVRRLLDDCRDDRQTVLFSATLDGDVDVLVRRYQHDPVLHELEVPEEELPDLEHHFWAVDRTARVATAAQVIDRMGPTVVFCRTKRGAERVAKQLTSAGVTAAAIHGDRSQNQRDRALEDFRSGRAAALVATDVAARGIHVDDVAAVIHFDPPEDPKDYVHRSGRTARAGARGVVVSLVIPEKASMVKGLQKALDLPKGLTEVDLASLGEPAPRAERPSTSPPPNRRSRQEARADRDGDRPTGRGEGRNRSRSGSAPRARSDRNGTERNRTDGEGSGRDAQRRDDRRTDRRRPDRRTEERDRDEVVDSPRRRRHRRQHAKDGRAAGAPTSGRNGSPGRSGSSSRNGSAGASGSRQGGGTATGRPSAGRSDGGRAGGPERSTSRPSSRGPRR
jgi:superfamily II DNA/RNA helicase